MRIILATCSPKEADALVLALVRERLVGCGNVIPGVRSFYWWEGEVAEDEECVLLMETTDEAVDAAVARLRALHSYDVPKIVTLDPASCDDDYLAWLRGEVASQSVD